MFHSNTGHKSIGMKLLHRLHYKSIQTVANLELKLANLKFCKLQELCLSA